MSWIRGQSTDYRDLSNDIVAAVSGISADSVDSVAAGGTGYVVGDLITLTGGTFTVATILEVVTISAGAVTSARIYNAGIYSVAPGDPVAQGSTTGSGTGATFNMTYSSNGWTVDRDTTWSGSEREVIIHGSGGGSDSIYVGWRTFQNAGVGKYNWEIHGMTGFSSGLAIQNQPGASPGDHESGVAAAQNGCYLTLQNSTMNWWLNVTPFRIILTVEVSGNYFHSYLGFINRYATSTEYPYPLLVAGSTNWVDAIHNQSETMSTLTDPWTHVSLSYGPMWLLDSSGTWQPFANSTINGGTRNSASIINLTLPCGTSVSASSASVPQQDRFIGFNTAFGFGTFIEQSDLLAPDANLEPTPGSGDDYYVMFPTVLIKSENSPVITQIYGEIDDVFWFSAFGGVVAQDRLIQDGQVYRVFPNCNRSGIWEFLAIKEA